MAHRDIVILANSRRHEGYCISGKDVATGEWIRPINILGRGQPRLDQEAFIKDDFKELIKDPLGPKLLDCVQIGFGQKCGTNCQPENIFIDGKSWEKISTYPRNQLSRIVDISGDCFLGKEDPYTDRIPVSDVKSNPLNSSLNFIKLNKEKNNVSLIHTQKPDGTYKHKMSFMYDTKSYRISVTDSYYEKVYQEIKIDDSVLFDDFFMTVGVGADEFTPEHSTIPYHFRLIVGITPSENIKEYPLR